MKAPELAHIQQTLHGYDAGHRLLQSSVELPLAARDVLAALSDLSGSRLHPGFESYLTGYQLPDTEYYVFARTWLAPEMPRPGCVWTHSLLIPLADLAHLQALGRLTRLHVRPARPVAPYGDYSLAIDVTVGAQQPGSEPMSDAAIHLSREVLRGLYGSVTASAVLVESESARSLETMLLAIWDQQWPRLRRSFRFCSGALSLRKLEGVPFDLQVMPIGAARLVRQSDLENRILVLPFRGELGPGAQTKHSSAPHVAQEWSLDEFLWIETLIEDLLRGDPNSEFRRWMMVVGAEVEAPRADAAFAATLAATLAADPPRVADAVELLAQRFPDAKEGGRLKTSVLGRRSLVGRNMPRVPRESAILSTLVRSAATAAFDSRQLEIRDRASELWRFERRSALTLLDVVFGRKATPLIADTLSGLCDAMEDDAVIPLSRRRPGLFYHLALRKPHRLIWPEVWQDRGGLAREAVAVLSFLGESERPPAEELVEGLVYADPSNVCAVHRYYGASLATSLIEAVISGTVKRSQMLNACASPAWRDVFADASQQVLAYLRDYRVDAWLAYALLEALPLKHSSQLPLEEWLGLLQFDGSAHAPREAAALLALALNYDSQQAGEVAGAAFPPVYGAVRDSLLADEAWIQLASVLPPVPHQLDWDRCERLRRGIANAFARKKPWKFRDFMKAMKDPEALRLTCEYGREQDQLRGFFKRLLEAIDDGRVDTTPVQRDAIRDARRSERFRFF